ncbi:PREDICTED: acyl-coenzyme A oxidase 3, peroxisomal-like [Ipomoea nil]|uniref:acyl-coenzyme A oxidase 3, peroxisomal-like n=1 Tax=Ipomoea nil TaxID=35883 RepID=UPI000901EDB8|nr:PREDICTED: acyl-coenzyme A oxidase 3, peroxisomal-like [Ipomoea nil]XP_019172424.1 PREDICTED: acyl-coenzyme A oxidase 3, peroxisomal-like [Ipomoea nil]
MEFSPSSSSLSSTDKVKFRTKVLSRHLNQQSSHPLILESSPCLSYAPPELSEKPAAFDVFEMRKLMDGHNLQERDWVYGIITQSRLFNPRGRGGKVFVGADYNQSMEQQREMTMKRIGYLLDCGVFQGWLTGKGPEAELRKLALLEVVAIFDQSLSVKIGVHFMLWGGAIQFFGTKRHHDKWLCDTENYVIKGCFAMTELGHGSNVRGIETVTTYDSSTGEFVINTPCESAQKYWIGGAANHATHTVVFSQLKIDGKDQGVHAFIAQIRDTNGNICPNVRITDCGHKIGLNGVDNGRIWFDNVRIPRENLLNSVADVSSDGKYLTAIKDPDQRFGAFMAPLTSGRVTISSSATYSAKVGITIAIRYSLTRRAFSLTPNGPEVLLLDYPSHQRRLLPLLAKTYAMSFAANYLKMIYVKRTPEIYKTIHIVSSGFKAILSWHNMRTLQECREACGGQGLKTENRIGQAKSEYDVHSTFEGDNNVLMQQVSKALLAEYVVCKSKGRPFKELGLEHMNESSPPVIPSKLSSDILRSIQFQNDILCLRERDLLNRFVDEVSQRQAQGESKENALLLSYQLAEDLGRAFTDRAIYHTFLEAEASANSGSLKNILGLVRSMYAMVTLDEDAAFLRYGCLTTDHASAVREEITRLCSDLRPHALALVNSFGIPDAFLSPIAFNWIDSNAWSSI